jgi:hypothetical protein
MPKIDEGATGWGVVFIPRLWRLGLLVSQNGEWLFALGPLRFAKLRNLMA